MPFPPRALLSVFGSSLLPSGAGPSPKAKPSLADHSPSRHQRHHSQLTPRTGRHLHHRPSLASLMIVYNKLFAPVLLALARPAATGLPRALTTSLCALAIFALVKTYYKDMSRDVMHTYPFQLIAYVVGFAVVFRANQAIARYMNVAVALSKMHSKWADAATELLFLDASGCSDSDDVQAVHASAKFADDVTHVTSVLSAAVLLNLRKDKGSSRGGGGGGGDRYEVTEEGGGQAQLVVTPNVVCQPLDGDTEHTRRHIQAEPASPLFFPSPSLFHNTKYSQARLDAYNESHPIAVLGNLTDDERQALVEERLSSDCSTAIIRNKLSTLWTRRIARREGGGLSNIPAPIVSRIPQFISDGFLWMAEAKAIVDQPFPFLMSTCAGILIFIYTAIAPLACAARIDEPALGASLAFLAVFTIAIVHESARELEDPTRVAEPNGLPLCRMQHELNARLVRARRQAAMHRVDMLSQSSNEVDRSPTKSSVESATIKAATTIATATAAAPIPIPVQDEYDDLRRCVTVVVH
ncbi:hypothetical protein PPROV_000041000 [Pycnococcus provasolii]|uniref:Bestrophin homolog n=1 Tax=Pycnococcus provasolii TaxID=41880 RepID=A0A830H5U9_9CHLO|nr:hypothetical protein PPROV_000041000 [Pycnococcus provasolii]